MTFDGIQVQHGKLETGAADVIRAARDIEARLNTLEDELNPLKSDWHGGAKLAYDDAKKKWDAAMTDMITLLTQAGQGVDTSNAEYKSADSRGAGRFPG
ncbi:WXG100 family type VII secretion target [Nocardioides seonyuensis]|uniref:ESAT-6-like protein n=1 Tax=Nocardioides seonyuensis TaxID=2518371 RepID=A0A4P7IDM8_9ACTN|nr:WXG100 family type VII secretion target [Nocardioides seonyuensis]QBX55188.1 WXG100 family type VII secretion target [Nocardioides seonyuensis]